jgi:hypothetical protein
MAIHNSAQLALAARRLAQAPKDAQAPLVDQESSTTNYVNGGRRAGKRKRGNSVTKKAPKTQTHAITYDVRDADGILVTRIRTLNYRNPE